MNELVKKDIFLKCISIVIAIILWFFVLDNNSNPFIETSLTVPIRVINEESLREKGIGIKSNSYTKDIVISVKGRKDTVSTISAKDFDAVLDFSKVQSAANNEIQIEGPVYSVKGIVLTDYKPHSVELPLENITNSTFNVDIETVGALKNGYKVISKSSNPKTIQIQGFESLINSVSKVKVFVEVSNLDRDTMIKRECKFYNKSNVEITDINKIYEADVTLNVAKEVVVSTEIKGKPASNYYVSSWSLNPNRVLITGQPETIASISELKLAPVDITNSSQNISVNRSIILPEGIKLSNGKQDVDVKVILEQLVKKELSFSNKDIVIGNKNPVDSTLKYDIVTQNIAVWVKGRKEDMEILNKEAMKPTIDVTGLGEGTHKLKVSFSLTESLKLEEDYYVEVKIEKIKNNQL